MGGGERCEAVESLAQLNAMKRDRAGSSRKEWDEAEFSALFHQQYGRLVSVAARLLGDRGQAEDMAAEALWRLYRIPELQGEGNNIPGWLFRTTTRLALDGLRSRRRWRTLVEGASREADQGPEPDSPAAALDARERAQQVRATLRKLKPAQANMLWLRHSGYSYQEIADALQMNPASVGTTLARAEAAFAKTYPRGRHEIGS